ncbi:hypothetical protein M988_4392 [Hafnia paralvei ATCC 29927]|uniref:hypothetical protein n=1 Tax=Hafnia paralvei TaxID=546367 RepID=UPI0007E49DC5|nr:hypothetical protein [Hafnia paralvei]OAT35695.1 hypothetical protein M988_4392 [Hafnia paralvei ATCC 29927]
MQRFTDEDILKLRQIAFHLSDGWVFNQLRSKEHYIYLTNKNERHCEIGVSKSDGFFRFISKVNDKISYTTGCHSTRSAKATRRASAIAADVRRHVLPGLKEAVEAALVKFEAESDIRNQQTLLLQALGYLARVNSGEQRNLGFCDFTVNDRVKGHIDKKYQPHKYDLELRNLSPDDVIKIVGFVSQISLKG